MKLLLVEPETQGHFLSLYARNVLKSLKNKKNDIYILTSRDIKKTKIFKILKKENKDLKILYCKNLVYSKNNFLFNLIINQFKNYLNLKLAIKKYNRKIKFDSIFFTNLDHIDKALCFFRNPFYSIKFSGILVNPRIHQFYKKKISVRYIIYNYLINKLFSLKKLQKVLTNDILFYKFTSQKKYRNKILFFNEPATKEKKQSPINNIIKENALNVLVYGAIRYSKSIEELIEITKLIKIKININVIFAGKQDDDVKNILEKKYLKKENLLENFKIINRFIEPEEEVYLFNKTQLVWCVYKNTPLGSSGVFHLSCNYKKPVITNNLGLVAWYNNKYKIGPILNFNTKSDLINSSEKIVELFKNKNKYNYYLHNQIKLLNLIKKQKKFKELINQIINKKNK